MGDSRPLSLTHPGHAFRLALRWEQLDPPFWIFYADATRPCQCFGPRQPGGPHEVVIMIIAELHGRVFKAEHAILEIALTHQGPGLLTDALDRSVAECLRWGKGVMAEQR